MKRPLVIAVLASLMLTACAHTPKWDDLVDNALSDTPVPETKPLVRTSAADLKHLLGSPDFVHKEKRSQIWRYDMPDCRILFYLYPDTEDNVLSVRQYQSLPDGRPGKLTRTCRKAIRSREKVS